MLDSNPASAESINIPALRRCLVVESRHSSRFELVRDLTASKLFDTVTPAASVADGVVLLKTKSFDACLVGPKLGPERTLPTLAQAIRESDSKDCALIAVSDHDKSEPEALKSAHGVMLRPYSTASLSDSVIRAVVKANRKSPWVGIMLTTGATPELDDENAESGSDSAEIGPTTNNSHLTRDLFGILASRLKKIACGSEKRIYLLTPSGLPTQTTKRALDKIAMEASLELQQRGELPPDFEQFLAGAFHRWFSDFVLEGRREAAANLSESLSAYIAGETRN